MNGFLMSLGGYISHNRCWVGVVDLVAVVGFFEVLAMMGEFTIFDLRFTISNQPPAMAGMMLISSPSLSGVCLFLRKRMSSSFT